MANRTGLAFCAAFSCLCTTTKAEAAVTNSRPLVDYHQHLLSPSGAALLQMVGGTRKTPALPPEISQLLAKRVEAWNDPKALAPLYSPDAVLTETDALQGRQEVAAFVGTRFGRPYDITPVAFTLSGNRAQLAANYTRGEGDDRTELGLALLTFGRQANGEWQITSEAMKFPGSPPLKSVGADTLIKLLDQAGIKRAVVLSTAYFFESPLRGQTSDGPARLRAENDWTAVQVGRYPDRLIGFCSVNPLTATALPEIDRCKNILHLKGLKIHAGNSGVDFASSEHVSALKQVFAEANRLRLPIVIHLWNGPVFGRRDAEVVLNELLPRAPDVVVQIAHMAGGGPGWTDDALQVFADAVERKDPRVRNLYFDVATVADQQNHQQLQLLARRIRQIGPSRILYGSDASFGGRNTPEQEWGTFRGMVPLSDAEFSIIRDNIAPWLRDSDPNKRTARRPTRNWTRGSR